MLGRPLKGMGLNRSIRGELRSILFVQEGWDNPVCTGRMGQSCLYRKDGTILFVLEGWDNPVCTGRVGQSCLYWKERTILFVLEGADNPVCTGRVGQSCLYWKDGTILFVLEGWDNPVCAGRMGQSCLLFITQEKLTLPGISYELSQRRYLIHSCMARKEF